MRNIILASNSPRRKELMKMAGFDFEIITKNVDETHPKDVLPELVPVYLARKKARSLMNDITYDDVVIGADTVVILEGEIFEKPKDKKDAISMLTALSGKMHEVVTGVCIHSKENEITFSETTKVYFNELTNEEIKFYVHEYEPFDKAGSYACQEWIGAVAINRFEGDYFNVVGLPINRVYKELKKF